MIKNPHAIIPEGAPQIPPEENEDLTHGVRWAGGAFGHIVNNLANPVVMKEDYPGLVEKDFGEKEKELLQRFVNLPEYIKKRLLKDDAKAVAEKLGTSLGAVEMAEELLKRFENMPVDKDDKYNQHPYLE